MASATSPSSSDSAAGDGPVLSLMSKRLRALRKKYNRILQMESSLAQGKTLNKEQEEVLRSKPGVVALIEEYERLRSPLANAVREELARVAFCSSEVKSGQTMEKPDESSSKADSALEDVITLLYFGCLFDVKPLSDFNSTMLMRTHERECCLTYDYVTDDATELLEVKDLDVISALGGLVTSRPLYSGISHSSALQGCLHHAKLWLQEAQEPIFPGSSVTYAYMREKLNKIMASDYFTTTPEMKAPVDVAAAVGKHNASCQAQVYEISGTSIPEVQSDDLLIHHLQQENEQEVEEEEDIHTGEATFEQYAPDQELQKVETDVPDKSNPTPQNEQRLLQADAADYNERNYERKDQQYPQRSYQNPRGGRGGRINGGYRGYSNPRGRYGRGGGGFENGRGNQYYNYDHPRNYYNSRGRAGRGGAMYNHHGTSSHGSHVSTKLEVDASA